MVCLAVQIQDDSQWNKSSDDFKVFSTIYFRNNAEFIFYKDKILPIQNSNFGDNVIGVYYSNNEPNAFYFDEDFDFDEDFA